MLSVAFWKNRNFKNYEKLEIIEIIAQSSFIQQQVLFGCSIGDWQRCQEKNFTQKSVALTFTRETQFKVTENPLPTDSLLVGSEQNLVKERGGNVGPKLDFNQSLTIPTFENFKIFVMLSAKLITQCTYNA